MTFESYMDLDERAQDPPTFDLTESALPPGVKRIPSLGADLDDDGNLTLAGQGTVDDTDTGAAVRHTHVYGVTDPG